MKKPSLSLFECADVLNNTQDLVTFLSIASHGLISNSGGSRDIQVAEGIHQCFELLQTRIAMIEDELRLHHSGDGKGGDA